MRKQKETIAYLEGALNGSLVGLAISCEYLTNETKPLFLKITSILSILVIVKIMIRNSIQKDREMRENRYNG